MTMKLNNGTTQFNIDESIAGHLLWEAMRDFREAYAALTQAAHQGVTDLEDADTPDDSAIRKFAVAAAEASSKITEALQRARLMHYGDVYDELINREDLGPEVDGHRKTVYTKLSMADKSVTHIREINTGMSLLAGLNVWDDDKGKRRQPIVAINTEGLRREFTYGDDGGMPIIDVDINDADIFDDAGAGDKIRSDAESMKHRLMQAHMAAQGKGDQGAFDVWNEVADIIGIKREEES